jgi:opacity protein-like surface antigen
MLATQSPPIVVIGGAVGYRFLDQPAGFVEQVRGELNLSYREADIDKVTSVAGSRLERGDVGAIALMANVYYDFDVGSPITPYLGGGIGFANIDIDSDSDADLVVNDDSTEFAWNVMLGASYAASEAIDLSLGYRYLSAPDPQFDASSVAVLPTSGKIDAEISLHEILFGLRYNF